MPISEIAPAAPEIFLAIAGMLLLLYGVFRGDGAYRAVSYLAVASLIVTGGLVFAGDGSSRAGLNGLYIADAFGAFAKLLILVASAASILLAMDFNRREQIARFEFPVLMVFATIGMMMMVSADDLIALYMGLELQSLALYVLAAFRRDSLRSSEAGLKYFVLGALSSGMLLYGMSLVYGF
ncbi:MAG: proton-conducting transporter membrane subunit, partial [Pseudomonadota bacterium]